MEHKFRHVRCSLHIDAKRVAFDPRSETAKEGADPAVEDLALLLSRLGRTDEFHAQCGGTS